MRRNLFVHISLILMPLILGAKSPTSKPLKTKSATQPERKPLDQTDPKNIIANYLFIDDFTIKPPEREISEEIFWKYRFVLPSPLFEIESELKDPEVEMPITTGSGLEYYHINRGRVLYLNGENVPASKVWLTTRARYGEKWPYDRRNDYYLGVSFTKQGMDRIKRDKLGWEDAIGRGHLANAATFLSWAFIIKEQKDDPLIDVVTPKQLANLAAIYYNNGRFGAAYGAAEKGLQFLRKTGRNEYRTTFNSILAETFIQNRSYTEAIKSLDTALRSSSDMGIASSVFARAADIYYDLNNYELAETNYALANRVDQEMERIRPAQFVLRAESLFWLGKFKEAQKMLHFALELNAAKNAIDPLNPVYASFAALRLADAYLADGQKAQAVIEYSKVHSDYRNTEAAKIAKVREACLDLPGFGKDGPDKNVGHARALLEASKDMEIPEQARELAWACHVLSFTERERTPQMVERVKDFYTKYPFSRRFLKHMIEPVTEVQASKLAKYLEDNDPYAATKFFEATRHILFKKIEEQIQADLFVAYVDTFDSKKAVEFAEPYRKLAPDTFGKFLRLAVFQSEVDDKQIPKSMEPPQELSRRLSVVLAGVQRSQAVSLYINRVQSTKNAKHHLPWIYALNQNWAKDDEKYTCSHSFPTLARIFREAKSEFELAQSRALVQEFVKAQMPDLFRKDENCAVSVLELEFAAFKDAPTELGQLYVARAEWPMIDELVVLFWNVAEALKDAKLNDQAMGLYRVIVEKGPANSPKVMFAKLRLDGQRTEFDKIWDE